MTDRKPVADDGRLRTTHELAAFMRYSESTVNRMVSQCPDRLPPRVATMYKPRWLPETVYQWARQSVTTQTGLTRRGRPQGIKP